MGTKIECKVIELNRSRNNVVLSRRAVLEEERKEQRQEILDRLQPGLVVEGQISNIVDFGAFVDLNGIDGLIHISELSWSHVNHPSEILNIGDTVQVKVLDIDRDRQRISLGLKQTQEDPWQRVVDTYNVGDELEGTVTKVVTFGAFVEILDGVEGLVHISELAAHHVENPREVVQPGDDVQREDPRDRLRAPPAVAVGQARRGPGPAAAACPTAPRRRCPSGAGDLDDVPDLGLSEDVFAGAAPDARARRRRARPTAARSRGCADAEAAAEAERRGGGGRAEAAAAPSLRRCGGGPAAPRPSPRRLRSPSAEAAARRARGRGAPSPRRRRPSPRPRRPSRDAAAAEPRSPAEPRAPAGRRAGLTRRAAARVPFVGLTGGMGAGKSTALAALERLGAATISDRRGRPRALRLATRCATPSSSAGARRSRPAASSTAPRSPATRSPHPTSARGSRGCCGRWSARGSRRGASERRRRATRRRAAAVVETPLLFEAGMDGVYDATIAVIADEDVRAERAGRPRPRGGRRARRAPAVAGGEGAPRDVRGRNSGTVERARGRAVRGP